MCRSQQENTAIAIFPFAVGVVCGCTFAEVVNILLFLPVPAVIWLFNRRYALWCMLGVLAGVAALSIDTFFTRKSVRELPETSMRQSFVCRNSDTRPAFVPGMPLPSNFVAEIIRIDGRKISSDIKILVRPGKGYFPRCGETFTGTGRFVPAESQSPFGKYLRSRKIYGVWHCNQLKTLSPPRGIFYQLCRLRDCLLERVISDMTSPVAKVLAGTLVFGAAGGFDRGLRQIFADSGTFYFFQIPLLFSGISRFAVCVFNRSQSAGSAGADRHSVLVCVKSVLFPQKQSGTVVACRCNSVSAQSGAGLQYRCAVFVFHYSHTDFYR